MTFEPQTFGLVVDKETGTQQSFTLRPTLDRSEARDVQDLSNTCFMGTSYQYYRELPFLPGGVVLVAVDSNGKVRSYVGLERTTIEMVRTMPQWNHEPRSVLVPDGSEYLITCHCTDREVLKSGLSRTIIGYLTQSVREANASGSQKIEGISVMVRTNHPTLGPTAPLFWERLGFQFEGTENLNWIAVPAESDRGGKVYRHPFIDSELSKHL